MANAHVRCRRMAHALATSVGVILLLGCSTDRTAGRSSAQTPIAVVTGKLRQCAACHGSDGISSAEIFPNLAGQQKAYLISQLTAFRDHKRQDRDAKTYMWGVATGLTDATIQEFAKRYATKPSAAIGGGQPTEVTAGAEIYAKGVAAHGVLAYVTCHGSKANGAAIIPSLAGQHKAYLIVQLGAFASGSRENAAMHLIAKAMTRTEITAVTAYLAPL